MLRKTKTLGHIKLALEKGYHVDETGQLFGPQGPRATAVHYKKTETRNRGAYHSFTLRLKGDKGTFRVYVHQLQAYQKFGEAAFQEGIHIRHLNGKSLDNSGVNIGLGTPSQNAMDRSAEDRKAHAKKAAAARKKWADADVRRLRRLRVAGARVIDLAAAEEVSKSQMSMMLSSKTYKDIT